SRPADRFLEFGYDSGYAGEATAWGFADPRQAVEFWVNSPGHRPIILNRWASEVGLGYTVDYTAPSVWYWSTEFGNASAAADAPELRVQTPQSGLELLNSEEIAFSWNWPLPLGTTEQFTVYLNGPAGPVPVGTVNQPVNGTLYGLTFIPATDRELLGQFEWQVKLENNRGAEITAGERRALTINLDPDLPTPTPMPTFVPTLQPEPSPTVTPTATPTRQQPTPRPTEPALPPLVTATPLPLDQ
ncbi:MAG: CAP domain-containing protein, partial [Candidatus Promineifilaceae bacterium]